MPLFNFKTIDKGGNSLEDTANAESKEELAKNLKAEGNQVLWIKPIREANSKGAFSNKISLIEKANFFRFMSTMLKAGLSIPEGVDVVKQETQSQKLKKVLSDLSYETRKGGTVTQVLGRYKDDFDPVIMAIVKVGEESGTLDKSFEYLSVQLTASYEMNQKIKGAMVYPMVVIFAMLTVGLYMMIGVMPKVAEAFSRLNIDMPRSSELVMQLGLFVGKNKAIVLGTVIGSIIAFAVLVTIPKVRKQLSVLFGKIKIIKKVLDQIDIARYARTLSTLSRRGVAIIEALEISASTLSQPKLQKAATEFAEEVSRGKLLSQALSEHKDVFPPALIQTVKAGEKTGMLDQVLEEMAEFYESEVERSIKKLTSLLEPILILGIGVVVGAMVIMMIGPIYNVVGNLQSSIDVKK